MKRLEPLINLLRKIPRKVLSFIFLVAVVVFFVLYLRSIDWHRLTHLHFNWVYLIFATVVATAFRYWGVMIWRYILTDLGATSLPSFNTMSYVYAKAWMGRYVPGTVTWIAGKVYMASSHGISKSRLAISSLLEGSMQAIAILVVSMLLLGFDKRLDAIPAEYKIVMIGVAGLLLLALTPSIFNRLMRLAYFIIKKKEPGQELLINEKAVLRSLILYALGGFIIGLSEFFISRTIDPSIPWSNFWFIVGAFNLAGALGILAIGVPSGLGVRDGVILLLLAAILPKEIALAITVVSRCWSALADLFFLGVTAFAHHLQGNRALNTPTDD